MLIEQGTASIGRPSPPPDPPISDVAPADRNLTGYDQEHLVIYLRLLADDDSELRWVKIVGPAELGHDAELRALAEELKLNRISIELPVYGENKRAVFEGADVFVLSSLNENFAMTVAESLAAGTPVISTKGAPWRGLETERCGWWIEPGVEPLAAALARAMVLPREELAEMGARGRAWMARDFGWETAAEKTLAVYLWLAGRSPRPDHVIAD